MFWSATLQVYCELTIDQINSKLLNPSSQHKHILKEWLPQLIDTFLSYVML